MNSVYFPDEQITYDDLKFVCNMIERTSRKVKQPNLYVAEKMGVKELASQLSLANVLHCKNPDDVVDQWIEDYGLEQGTVDRLQVNPRYVTQPPTALQMGKVYARLVDSVITSHEEYPEVILRVLHSPICEYLDNYDCGAYYEPSYVITRAFIQGQF